MNGTNGSDHSNRAVPKLSDRPRVLERVLGKLTIGLLGGSLVQDWEDLVRYHSPQVF